MVPAGTGHLLRAPHPPSESLPSREKGKAANKTSFRRLRLIEKTFQEACRQPIIFHPGDHLAAKPLPPGTPWELFLEIGKPAREGTSGYLENGLKSPGAGSPGSFLPKSHDYQDHASPVDPPPHEQTRRWQGPLATSFTATAKALPYEVFLGDRWQAPSGFAYVVGLMQRTATMGTPLFPLVSSKV
jgi:hypothetical protein